MRAGLLGIWEISVKDVRLILKDRGALYTLLALPVVVIAILGMSTGQLLTAEEHTKQFSVGLVDESGSETAKHVFRDLSAIGGLKVEKVSDRDEARLQLQDGRSSVVVVLGQGFEERINDLEPADVFDPDHGALAEGLPALDVHVESAATFAEVADLVKYVVFSAVMRAVAPEVIRHNRLMSRFMHRVLERHAAESQTQASKHSDSVKAGASIIYQTIVPAFLVMFAFFLVNIMARSFIDERNLGTLRRLQMSRVGPVQLLCGKTLPFLAVSIAQSVLLFLAGKLLFGMSWGTHPSLLLPVIVTTSMAATGLGLLLATIVRTESQVASYSTFLVVVLGGISGCYMPRAWLPEIMKQISLVTPHAWALIAYQEILTRERPDLQLVAECCAMMAAMGIIFFGLGAVRFRKSAYPS